jgi:N,N-dimethylformamidase
MLKLTGYSDRIYARPGEVVKFMVNCAGPKFYRADIVRLICGDSAPAGPGFKEEFVKTAVNGRYKGRTQTIHAGSYVIVPASAALDALRSFTIQAFVWPTSPGKGVQGLVSKWSSRDSRGFALIVDEKGAIALHLGTGRGKAEKTTTGVPLLDRHWYLVGASYNAEDRQVTVFQRMMADLPGHQRSVRRSRRTRLHNLPPTNRPLLMGAIELDATERLIVSQHYNGKIDRPRLTNRVLTEPEIESLCGDIPGTLVPAIVGAWDYSCDISAEKVSDLSPNRLHGETINLPARAMTGANWTGEVMDWRQRPTEWGAIHFHEDDLYDAGWEADFELRIPAAMRSGIYAARLRAGPHEEYVPFAVGPNPGEEARIAFLMPTASYMAYANEHIAIDSPTAELTSNLASVIYPRDVFLNEHREYGGSMYDLHTDGSGVCYSSRLRPILNMRPKCEGVLGGAGPSKLWQFNADTHITDWLEARGHRFDVITDEELHDRGVALLEPYRVILTGTHPEYWSTEMWDAMDAYKKRGGRLMYLGGNGFYWRVAYHPT